MTSPALALLIAAGGIRVEAEPPDSPCPDAASVEKAVSRHLPASSTEGGEWRLRYRAVSVEGDMGGWRIELRLVDSHDRTQLVRTLEVPATECPAAATALAAIVERHFAALGWTAGAPLPRPGAMEATPQPSAEAPGAGALASVDIGGSSLAARSPWLRQVAVSAGPALSAAGGVAAGAALDVRMETAAIGPLPLRLGIGTMLPPQRRSASFGQRGQASATRLPGRLSATAVLRLGRFELEAGPEASVAFEWAESSEIRTPGSRRRVTAAAGLVAGAALRLSKNWAAGLEGAVHRSVLAERFFVDAPDGRHFVLDPPPWQGVVVFKLSYVFAVAQ